MIKDNLYDIGIVYVGIVINSFAERGDTMIRMVVQSFNKLMYETGRYAYLIALQVNNNFIIMKSKNRNNFCKPVSSGGLFLKFIIPFFSLAFKNEAVA